MLSSVINILQISTLVICDQWVMTPEGLRKQVTSSSAQGNHETMPTPDSFSIPGLCWKSISAFPSFYLLCQLGRQRKRMSAASQKPVDANAGWNPSLTTFKVTSLCLAALTVNGAQRGVFVILLECHHFKNSCSLLVQRMKYIFLLFPARHDNSQVAVS